MMEVLAQPHVIVISALFGAVLFATFGAELLDDSIGLAIAAALALVAVLS